MYVFTGLLEVLQGELLEEALTYVLAHELGHVTGEPAGPGRGRPVSPSHCRSGARWLFPASPCLSSQQRNCLHPLPPSAAPPPAVHQSRGSDVRH